MSRPKRASMREGPLSDLFRSTSDDAPADPPEVPRYGREDPAEAKKKMIEPIRVSVTAEKSPRKNPATPSSTPETT